MNASLHERAKRLIDVERVEGLSSDERTWLQSHLRDCVECAGWASATDAALRTLITVPVAVPPGLALATSLRVRRELVERKQRRARNVGLAAICAASWLVGVATAPLVWRACAWLGSEFELPRIVWVLGFAFWWFVPPAAATGLILWLRGRAKESVVSW